MMEGPWVKLAGDHCTICQENMRQPISLRCKHVFCEDCVTEWFERERTCPLCRAVIKSTGVRSFGDGSTGAFTAPSADTSVLCMVML
ncbi:hypothetical protein CYMTET_48531 [Cymbomonas tetramitiformis]|uniref:RING-type domain-containing protein n=1 Tax=Cymbomonas tetramitiformis TaxID=36881 RepID=A0AAE0BU02_9CHLO|nr:hypothetical protein CYMTET_48531 [Cymbomonas tetramitiformis]